MSFLILLSNGLESGEKFTLLYLICLLNEDISLIKISMVCQNTIKGQVPQAATVLLY